MVAKKSPEEFRAAREAKLEDLQEQLHGAVEKLVTGADWKQALAFAARFRSRSFNNTILIFEQHQLAYDAGKVPHPLPTLVAGFRQWQEHGRNVVKGQRGYAILAPVTGKFASKTPKNPASWRKLGRGEKPRSGEVVQSKMIGVKPAYVFDVSQTNGDPIPVSSRPQLLVGDAPAGLREGLITQIRAAGFEFLPIPHEGMIDGANGRTNFTDRNVAVRTNMDEAAQVKTIAHELAHVLLHDPDDEDATRHRGIGEVEAESVALMIGAAHDMDTSSYSVPYVASWALNSDGKDPLAIVSATAEKVRKTAVGILTQLDTDQINDGTLPPLTRDSPTNTNTRAAERKTPARTAPKTPTPGARTPSTVRAL